VRGRELRVAVRPGDGSRTPLLLFNGIGAGLELLDPFVRELDPAVEVIRFDVPGVGGSPLSRPYHFTTLVPLIADLLDRLGHDQVDVLGISWGGGLAQQFAFQRARRCRRLVLVATGTGVAMVPARPKVLLRMLTPRRHRDPEYAASIAGEIYGGLFRTDPYRARDLLHDIGPTGPRRGYLYQLLAGSGWTSLPLLPHIRQPTLVIASDDDPIIPLVNARIMRGLLPRGHLHVHHGGHLGLLTEAADLAPIVDTFLRGDTPATAGL
jgi:poly(3-hydroxyalkanoate) depolymerase